ncbi:MAG TPA: serpin family protein [Blastocatellia bacterium]|nr:serpin family protein [Blastocatellia bacterium]
MIARLLRMNLPVRAVAIALLFAMLGCAGVSHSDITNNPPANSNAANANESAMDNQQQTGGTLDPRLAAAGVRFGFKLYAELVRQSAEKNIFISPSSIALCLAMAYNGAAGETRQAMAQTLETQALSLDELNRAYAALRAALESPDAKARLQIANSLWAREGLRFKADFIERNKNYFGAQVTALNFDDPAAPATINRWVSEKTNGKIDRIVDQIDPSAVLFLINAIYFKGAWQKPFDVAKTKEDNFTLVRGTKRLPMMSQSGNYPYLETKEFQAVSLPYGGGRISFYVFLPTQQSSLAAFEKRLTESNWQQWVEQFRATDGDISLPRFRVTYEATLNDALKALGMGVAFDEGRANFSGMIETGGQRVFISNVRHKTFAEVNEEGTEAAAVTSTEMRATSMRMPRERFRMVVDRPFFCVIRDNTSGAVLFMGSIYDPQ